MEITNRAVDSLIPYSLNNRTHPAEQVARIANSIAEFGFNQPIVIDENNVVLVGHGRLMAAQKLGLKDVPTLKLENLSESKKRAYRILDNKLQNDSEWELDNLKLELQMLEDDGFALEPWGLDSLIPEDETPEVVEDDFEAEEIEEPYIKEGDLIELGEHRVLCGDSTQAEEVAFLLKNESPPVCLTDPPYGIGVDQTMAKKSGTQYGKAAAPKRTYELTDWDHLPPAEAITQAAAFPQSIIFGGNYFNLPPSRCWLVWDKENGSLAFADCELAWTNLDQPVRLKRHLWNGMIRKDKEERSSHPTQKPVGVIAWCMEMTEGDVYDPYLGSGTTLIAAEQLGRKCYGMEISPTYCQVILERYQAYCEKEGKPFVCRINGEPFDGKARS